MGCGALLHSAHFPPGALSFYELKEGRVHALVPLVLIKIFVQWFECKFPERVLLTGAISTCKRFQMFHTGVKLSRMCDPSLLAATFTF